MSRQTALLNRDAQRVARAIESLRAQRFLPRLWEKDAALWSAEPAVQEAIRGRLGWLSITTVMARQTDSIRRLAAEVREAGFTHALLVGMGGSSLFPEVCRLTFGVAPGGVDVGILDSTDPAAIRALERRAPLERTLAVISSKSGTTAEVLALTKYFYDRFKAAGGTPGDHCIAVTDHGTPLEALAQKRHFRRILTHGIGSGSDVGGRFSALTYFGLVPAALLGVDIGRLLERADTMVAACGPAAPLETNPAVQLGAALGALAQAGRNKLTLLCAPEISSFGAWVEQLIAESSGKLGQGIVPIHGEPLYQPGTYAADRLFVELQTASRPDAAIRAHAQAVAAAGHPVLQIEWDDAYDVGAEGVKWFVATAVAGGLLGINPFDEPNVKESKDRTNALLERYVRERRFPDERPVFSDGGIAVFGRALSGQPASLVRCLSELVQRRQPGDYAAVLSFLPRTPSLDRAVQALRERLGARLGLATMLGFGPRYLHSTGQLYKGGRDCGLFLLLTADECEDLAIPGEPFTFGTLKAAQALGDFEAMQQKGRRILRVHLGGSPEQALPQLQRALEAALVT